MKHYLLFLVLLAAFACSENNSKKEETTPKTNEEVDSSEIQSTEPLLEQISDANTEAPFYIISVAGFENIDSARKEALILKEEYEEAGFLWIPDYESLSGKEMYVVFLGPYTYESGCMEALFEYKNDNPSAYAVLVQHKDERKAIYDKFDFRLNGQKQKMVLTYAKPEESEEYFEEGGEDWGWFTGDVGSYLSHYHSDVIYSSVYNSWLDESDIKKLESEMELDGFGYIMINGNEKSFTHHDLPDGVISAICEFFEFEYQEDWQGEISY